jgi:hypothetical protein
MIVHKGVYVCARCKPIFLQKLVEGAKIEADQKGSQMKRFVLTWRVFWITVACCAAAALVAAILVEALRSKGSM